MKPRRPSDSELLSSHLMRLGSIADRVPPPGELFPWGVCSTLRICVRMGATHTECAQILEVEIERVRDELGRYEQE